MKDSLFDRLLLKSLAKFGVAPDRLFGSCKDAQSVRAREFVAFRLRKSGLSYPQIGRLMRRAHSSVQDMERRARMWM